MGKDELDQSGNLRFPKPKILVLDCSPAVAERLLNEGYNVKSGTFGRPYRVPCEDRYTPVISQPRLPNYTEQEVVIIDLTPPDVADGPDGEKDVSYGTKDWWASMKHGLVDPRPRAMAYVRRAFDRLFCHGGIFVVFCQPRHKQEMSYATGDKYGRIGQWAEDIDHDNWSFLPLFDDDWMVIKGEHGVETLLESKGTLLTSCFARHVEKAEFTATLHPEWRLSEDSDGPVFLPLMKNKYGSSVGGVIFDTKTMGLVLLLPHFADKPALVHDLIMNVLPDIAPHRFPFSERTKWLMRDEYEHPRVVSLIADQNAVRERAEKEIADIDAAIATERQRLAFLHGVLTKTGDELVQDVKQALETIGFSNVIDADKEAEEGAAKQEDLQIHDIRPILLVEIKGINGLPTEGDTLQVVKYIPRRMKEWQHTDVSGVAIVNHQRSIPPLERRHDAVFTKQQQEDAEHHDIVLLTTWELFRLIRGMLALSWSPDVLRGLFYGKGRVDPIPKHWKCVGKVSHFYDKAGVVSIELTDTLKAGDRIGFLLPSEYIEEDITSLQVEREQVEQANAGQRVGHKTTRLASELRDGVPVYIVDQQRAT